MKSYVGISIGLIFSLLFIANVSARNNGKSLQTYSSVIELKVVTDLSNMVKGSASWVLDEKKTKVTKPTKEESSIVKVGDAAPEFTVKMLDGQSVKLSDKKGKIVLLNFWATWCGPCMKEFEEIPDKIISRFGDRADFVFIPVSRGETEEVVRKKMKQLKKNGIYFPVGLDPERKIYDLYAKTFIPRNYLIDKEGKIVYMSVGYSEKEFDEMVEKIAELLSK